MFNMKILKHTKPKCTKLFTTHKWTRQHCTTRYIEGQP
jgi:hypothetical protein